MVGDVDQICADCGAVTEPGEDFCGECGAYLEWEERPAAAPEPVAAVEPEPDPGSRSIAERVKSAIGIGDEPAGGAPPPGPPPGGPPTGAPPTGPPPTGPPPTGAPPMGPPPTGPPPGTPPPPPVVGPVAPGTPVAPVRPGSAVKPGATAPKPRRRSVSPDKEPIQPGDLICGECGAGNKPTRKFCRRCGLDLKEAVVAKAPWWRRPFTRKRKPGPTAGERPHTRRMKLRRPNRTVGVLLVLAILGGGGYFGRGLALGLVDTVVDRVKGTAKLNPDSMEASSSQRGHPPRNARDGFTNKYWAPAEPANAFLVARFDTPFRLVYLNIAPGVDSEKDASFLAHGRPSKIKVTVTREDGPSVVETIELEDKAGFQEFHIPASDATAVKLQVLGSYKASAGTAIAEVEFYSRK